MVNEPFEKVPKPGKDWHMKNKRGWIRIVEAFVAVLLITGVVLLVINKGYIGKEDISERVYSAQWAVLRSIELNPELRVVVLEESIGNEWEDIDPRIKNQIQATKPNYLDCEAKICALDEICQLSYVPDDAYDKDVYSQSITIAAEGGTYHPRQLKLFCWTR